MKAHFAHQCPLGAQLLNQTEARYSIWAPAAEQVMLEIEGREPLPMVRDKLGVHTLETASCGGTAYHFRIGDVTVPDPASRAQLHDVHGPSLVIDPLSYEWQCHDWLGRPWEEVVIYEMHAGCYGGFAAMEEHLAYLADLGMTAIELMPIADFPGTRNWGYDGVLPYAPDRAYGSPTELKRLIDTAHSHGLCVYLDVVYNHFGPDGNYLHKYAPAFFSPEKESPWGPAIDFGQEMVRNFFTENALYWLMEYRFDGLRLDAVHAISDPTWLDEMAGQVRLNAEPGRHIHLMLENERNVSSHLEGEFDAQWNDDIHNVIHVLLTGEGEGYYANYQQNPARQLARALAEGFVYQGEPAPAHNNRRRGTASGHLPPHKFIFFLQNHDQVGNRAFGERLTMLANPDALRAATTLQLLCPQIPLLFMGEERGLQTPFLFFTDFEGDLAEAVKNGRRAEFSAFSHFSDVDIQNTIPDPNSRDTFYCSAAPFQQASDTTPDQLEMEQEYQIFYRKLLQLRRTHIIPNLSDCKSIKAFAAGDTCVVAEWQLGNYKILRIVTNLGPAEEAIEAVTGQLIYESRSGAGEGAAQGKAVGHATSVFIDEGGRI